MFITKCLETSYYNTVITGKLNFNEGCIYQAVIQETVLSSLFGHSKSPLEALCLLDSVHILMNFFIVAKWMKVALEPAPQQTSLQLSTEKVLTFYGCIRWCARSRVFIYMSHHVVMPIVQHNWAHNYWLKARLSLEQPLWMIRLADKFS